MLPIFEHQQGSDGRKTWRSRYQYIGRRDGLHAFDNGDGRVELFAKRKSAPAGWHLERGAYFYEFCRSA